VTVGPATVGPSSGVGESLRAFMRELFPICRSITGAGVRQTLAAIGTRIPLEIHEVASGTQVLDWTVPDEWTVRAAYIEKDGRRIVNFEDSNLHLVGYSEPFRGTLSLDELRPRLHSSPEHPTWIPYRTSYYSRTWGFCLSDRQLNALASGEYEVVVDTTLAPGSLTYGECLLPGERDDEVLLTTHICHPSLANDNLSGIAVLTEVGAILREMDRKYSYRLLFIPGTIGSITWLALNKQHVDKIAAGLVLACLGDPAPLSYKCSRRGDAWVDRAAAYALRQIDPSASVVDFEPWGWDERQFNSPGFDLPVGCLNRSREGEYEEYHSSADSLDIISSASLEQSLLAVLGLIHTLELDGTYVNLAPEGEPQLGMRGLYPSVGGPAAEREQLAMLWVLNQSDGKHSLLEIADRSGIPLSLIFDVTQKMVAAELLRAADRA
jgi:aminopeptidase-like protein